MVDGTENEGGIMRCARRGFLQQGLALGSALLLPAVAFGQVESGDLFSRMSWMNEPKSVKREGNKLVVMSRGKTDFWRRRFTGTLRTMDTFSVWRLRAILRFRHG